MLHLVKDGIDMLDTSLDSAGKTVLMKNVLNNATDFLNIRITLAAIVMDSIQNLLVYIRTQIPKALILQLNLDPVQTETVGKWSVDGERFLGDGFFTLLKIILRIFSA